MRKIGSYLTADLLVPVNWQQEEISFVVHSVSGAVLSRYHVEKNTLERVGDSGALSENLPANLKNAVVSKLFSRRIMWSARWMSGPNLNWWRQMQRMPPGAT